MRSSKEIKFIVDDMLGKLAKWLRVMGYDVLYFKTIPDRRLIQKAIEDDRIILTRDTHLITRRALKNREWILIKDDDFERQLKQVIEELNLDVKNGLLTRCLECNQELGSISKELAAHKVPAYVYKTQENFFRCPGCQRIYWQGSHWARMVAKIREITRQAREF